MRRRTFLSTLPAGALIAGAGAASAGTAPRPATAPPRQTTPADPFEGVGPGNRNSGLQFVSRSTVWGANGAAATAHPRATLLGIDTLRRGGSAIDAAIAINAALGFLEPTANGIGVDRARDVDGDRAIGRQEAVLRLFRAGGLERQAARAVA